MEAKERHRHISMALEMAKMAAKIMKYERNINENNEISIMKIMAKAGNNRETKMAKAIIMK
jgi:hypothetical protein